MKMKLTLSKYYKYEISSLSLFFSMSENSKRIGVVITGMNIICADVAFSLS